MDLKILLMTLKPMLNNLLQFITLKIHMLKYGLENGKIAQISTEFYLSESYDQINSHIQFKT